MERDTQGVSRAEGTTTKADLVEEVARTAELTKKQAEADLIARHAEAANRATRIWSAATGAPRSHPYLLRKRIQPHGARSYKGTLVLPVTTFADKLTSLQFISSAGRKSKRIFRTSPCSRRSGHRMPRRNGWAH